jgi:hypothetical protein
VVLPVLESTMIPTHATKHVSTADTCISYNSSAPTLVSTGSLPTSPPVTRKGQATIGCHAAGKPSQSLGICDFAIPRNQKFSPAISSPHANTCISIARALGLRSSNISVHRSGMTDDMAMIRRAVALVLSKPSRMPLYITPM